MKSILRLIFLFVALFIAGQATAFGQITPPSRPDILISYCSLPSSEIPIPTIVFEENNDSDFIVGENTFSLSVPQDFILSGEINVTSLGSDLSNIKASLENPQNLLVTFDVLSYENLDKISISGLFVSTSTQGVQGDLKYNSPNSSILGIDNNHSILSIIVDDQPLEPNSGILESSQTVCQGSSLTPLVVSGSIKDFSSYQWEVSYDNVNFSPILGQTGVTYTPMIDVSGVKYFRRQTIISKNGVSCSAFSNSISITVIDVIPGEIGGDQSLCFGETPSGLTSVFDAEAMGENISYSWEKSTDEQVTWEIFENNSTTFNPGPLTQTTYYRRIATSLTCATQKKSNIVSIKVASEVIGGTGVGAQELCLNDTSTIPLSVSGASNSGGEITYQWQFSKFNNPDSFVDVVVGEGRNKAEATYTPDTSVAGTTFFRRITTVTNDGVSCSAISTPVEISVVELNAGLISPTQSICIGKTASQITVSGSTISDKISYQWYLSNDNITFNKVDGSVNDFIIPDSDKLGTYYYKRELIFSGSNGICSVFSDTVTVNVIDVTSGLFDVSVESVKNPLCYGVEGGSATIRVDGGSAPYFYSIDGDELISFGEAGTSQSIYTIQNIGSGIHNISITDSNSCSVEQLSVSISMPNELIVTHFEQNQVSSIGCNTPGSLSVSVSGGSPPYFYSWNGPEGYSSTSTNSTINDISIPGNYIVTVTDKNQCSQTLSVNMPETASLFTIEGIVNSEQCVSEDSRGSSISLFISSNIISPYNIVWEKWDKLPSANPQGNDPNNPQYDWIPIQGSSGKLNLTGLGYGEYRVKVQDSNTAGCNVVTKTFSINKSDLNVSEINLTNPSCDISKGEYSFRVQSVNPVKYILNGVEILPDTSNTNSFNFSVLNNTHVISNLSAGTYNLKIIDQIPSNDTFKSGCEIFLDFTIENYETIKYTGETNITLDICENTSVFPDISFISGGNPFITSDNKVNYIYYWKGPNNFQSFGTSPINVVEGTYELIIQDSVGCNSSPYIFNFSYDISPIEITDSITPLGCGENNSDGAISINILGGKAPYNIIWEREIPGSLENSSPTYQNIGTNLLAINNLSEGRYRLTIESSLEFCSNSSLTSLTKFYTLSPQETLTLKDGPYLSRSLCLGDSGTIQLKVFDKSSQDLSFYYNNELLPQKFLGNDIYELAIESPVEEAALNITNEFGCGISIPIITGVGEPDFSYTSTSLEQTGLISADEKVFFTNTSKDPFTKMEWDFGDGSTILEVTPENQANIEISHRYVSPGTFTVSLRFYNAIGCYKEVEQEVRVGRGYLVVFPSAFTPNGDGINDFFECKFTGIKSFVLEIFDMWGNLIYTKKIENLPVAKGWGWKGTYNNSKIYPHKTFRYRFTAITHDDQQINNTGEAILIR